MPELCDKMVEKYRVDYSIDMRRSRLRKRIKHQTLQRREAYERGDTGLFTETSENLVFLYDSSGDYRSASRIRMELAGWYLKSGDFPGVLEVCQDWLKQARKADRQGEIVSILSRLGHLFLDRGDSERALKFFIGALETAKRTGSSRVMADILFFIGEIYQNEGEVRKALGCLLQAAEKLDEAIEGVRTESEPNSAANSAPGFFHGVLALFRGAEGDLFESFRLGEPPVAQPYLLYATIAGIQASRGEEASAVKGYERSAGYALESGVMQAYVSAVYNQALLEDRMGHHARAEFLLTGLLQTCGEQDLPVEESLAIVLLVQIRLKTGSSSGSLALLQDQVDAIRRRPAIYPPESFLVFKLLGDHCRYYLKDSDAADRYYALFRKMAGKLWEKSLTE